MEVHHHPDLHHKPKPWKEYLLEYLMIFLAVMTGFFAESYREHLSDKSKEKEYLLALRSELQTDTLHYNKQLTSIFYMRPLIDSLFENAKDPAKYNYTLIGTWNTPINEKNVTYAPALAIIQQLKSSGNLRLIDKKDIGLKIIEYETYIEGTYRREYNTIDAATNKLYAMEDELCDETEFNNWLNKHMLLNKDMLSGSKAGDLRKQLFYNMPLKVRDQVQLNRLANSAVNYKGWLAGYIPVLFEAKKQAVYLLKLINDEYGLEE